MKKKKQKKVIPLIRRNFKYIIFSVITTLLLYSIFFTFLLYNNIEHTFDQINKFTLTYNLSTNKSIRGINYIVDSRIKRNDFNDSLLPKNINLFIGKDFIYIKKCIFNCKETIYNFPINLKENKIIIKYFILLTFLGVFLFIFILTSLKLSFIFIITLIIMFIFTFKLKIPLKTLTKILIYNLNIIIILDLISILILSLKFDYISYLRLQFISYLIYLIISILYVNKIKKRNVFI